jgi:hypothetical protein
MEQAQETLKMKCVVRNCLSCGRDTKSKSQLCTKCLGTHSHKPKDSAVIVGPLEELKSECEHDYSEDALGPHESDKRWSYIYVEDECF